MKNKIRSFVICVFLLLCYSVYADTNSAITGAADKGGDLGPVSTDALKEAGDYAKRNGYDNAYNNIKNELDRREAQMRKEAEEAETAAVQALKDLMSAEQDLNSAAETLKKLEEAAADDKSIKKSKEYKAAVKSVEECKNNLEQAKTNLNKAADAVTRAYNALGDFYSQIQQTGDPVQVSSGKYLASYDDYVAQDFGNVFTVQRNLTSGLFNERLGNNWTCSISSRIIRCTTGPMDEKIQLLEDSLETINHIIKVCENYEKAYPNHPKTEIKNFYQRYENIKKDYENYLELALNAKEENLKKDELNKYVSYGRFLDYRNYYYLDEALVYVDRNGESRIFKKTENNIWEPLSPLLKGRVKIESLSNDEGFVVKENTGCEIYYDFFGVLKAEKDKNNNLTKYYSENGLIKKILLKTGETLFINYNQNNLIESVTGSTSGKAAYKYDKGNLIEVTGNDDIKIGYKYDSDGDLSCIEKSDGSCVLISYGYDDYERKVCTSVKDENNYIEYFKYNAQENEVEHITIDGGNEYYKYNDLGNVTYKRDEYNNSWVFENDDIGLITVEDSGKKCNYIYDENNYINRIIYKDGSSKEFIYDNFGNLLKITDEDGFYNNYEYDSKGNLIRINSAGESISSIKYYPNGLIEELQKNDCLYSFEYNQFGSIIKKITLDLLKSELPPEVEHWKYNSKNQVVEYISKTNETTIIIYGNNYRCEIINNRLKKEHFFNSRKWETKTVETDLKNGTSYIKEIVYDNRGNILKIFLNGEVFTEYSYLPSGKLCEWTVWNLKDENLKIQKHGIRYKCEFDKTGKIEKIVADCIGDNDSNYISNITKIISQMKYSNVSTHIKVEHYTGLEKPDVYIYSENGKLIYEEKPDGFYRKYSYSKAGRLISVIDSNGVLSTCSYLNNGEVIKKVQKNCLPAEFYHYSRTGNLIEKTDIFGSRIKYAYNGKNQLITEQGNHYRIEYEYDVSGHRKNTILYSDNNVVYSRKEIYEKDFITIENGSYIISRCELDPWKRVVAKESQQGRQRFIYNAAGQVVKIIYENSNCDDLAYNALGKIAYEKNESGDEWLYSYNLNSQITHKMKNNVKVNCINYNEAGLPIEIINDKNSVQKINYDFAGNIKNIFNYDTGEINFDIVKDEIVIRNSYGSSRYKKFNSDGLIIQEQNFNGAKKKYSYSDHGTLKSVIDYNGKQIAYNYNSEKNSLSSKYEDGEVSTVTRNYFNLISQHSNNNTSLKYTYDDALKLVRMEDAISGFVIDIKYDSFGRLQNKKSEIFDIEYSYDSFGKLKSITDKKSLIKIDFKINQNREIKISYNNGNSEIFKSNALGQTESYIVKDRIGQIIYCELNVYDDNNRLWLQCNQNGEVTSFTYDSEGHLISENRLFTDSVYDRSLKEYIYCGGFETPDVIRGNKLELNQNVKNKLITLAKNNSLNLTIPMYQYSWKTNYEYTSNGSVKSSENGFGKIIYDYDKGGRLIHKHVENTSSGGISYEWSEDDCLKSENCLYYKIEYEYGNEKRPVRIHEVDFETSREKNYEYTYDSLGRRYLEKINGKNSCINIYDGLRGNILCKLPVFENGRKSVMAERNNLQDDSQFRTLKENTNTLMFKTGNENIYDETIAMEPYVNIGVGNSLYLSLYLSDNKLCIENLRKKRNNECIWDINSSFGYRDYNASMKCFTTSDPVSDGGNYFAYCATDPVNYSDMEGFRKTSLTKQQEAEHNAAIANYLKFDQATFESGNWGYLVKEFDCADTSAQVNLSGIQAAGTDKVSPALSEFGEHVESGNIQKAKDTVNSWSFFEDGSDSSYTKIFNGYDSNYLKNTQFKGSEKYSREEMNREVAYYNLSNPDYISPGTVLVWQKSDYSIPGDNGNWIGHTLTVLAREFDANGNIIGIAYIEGHQGVNTLTEIGYMSFDPDVRNLDLWRGDFLGAYEMESSNDHWNGMIQQNKSTCCK